MAGLNGQLASEDRLGVQLAGTRVLLKPLSSGWIESRHSGGVRLRLFPG